MIALDCKNEILIRFFKNKESLRNISKKLGVNRITVSKYVHYNKVLLESTKIETDIRKILSIPPKYYQKGRKRFILTQEIKEEINKLLIQNHDSLNKKTSINELYNKEIHSILINKGYTIGYTTVCNYIRLDRLKNISVIDNPKVFNHKNYTWFHNLIQGSFNSQFLFDLYSGSITLSNLDNLINWIKRGTRKERNKAVSILCFYRSYSIRTISKYLLISRKTIQKYIDAFQNEGILGLTTKKKKEKKYENLEIVKNFFKIFHTPPKNYNINRTTWIQKDLKYVFEIETGIKISKPTIKRIIKNAGYSLRKAKKVLTSHDPKYIEKVQKINEILAHLKPDEKFFSIDEFGPFAIKIQGGKSYVKNGKIKTYPQWQKSKGSLIVTAAIELSGNQVTHFYSEKNNTEEMIKLLEILLIKYKNEKCIYFSWDAASWHASKELTKKVNEINESSYFPKVELAPLPNGAQFLNVIESIFSGMSRAIIHNSDYANVGDCEKSIDRYFIERNEYYTKNPKKAGNKIWKNERVISKFDESNNCKDAKYER